MKKVALFLVVIMLGIVSCVGMNETNIPSDENLLVTPTASVTVSLEPTERIEPTATNTPSPTLLPTRSPTIMPTPKATLLIEEKEKRFREMLEGTEGCLWPCIGGVEPGVTLWEEAIHILGDFLKWESPSDDNLKSWSFQLSNEGGWYSGYLWRDEIRSFAGLQIETSLQTNIIPVDKVLSLYGEPSEIYIDPAYPDPAYGYLNLVLVYRERRSMLFFEWDEDRSGQSVLAYDPLYKQQALMCLVIIADEDFSWSPQDVSNAVVPYNDKPRLYTMTEVTGMTNEQFTHKFAVPSRNNYIVCARKSCQMAKGRTERARQREGQVPLSQEERALAVWIAPWTSHCAPGRQRRWVTICLQALSIVPLPIM